MATSSYVKYGNWSFTGKSGYPVPVVSIAQEQQRNAAGRAIGSSINITLEGKIYPTGSIQDGFSSLLSLESGLRKVFSIDGQDLTIGCSGSASNTFSGIKINKYNANKTEDNWTTTIDYSIELQSEVLNSGSGIFYVSSTQDDWSIETIDETSYVGAMVPLGNLSFLHGLTVSQASGYPFYRISRTLGAVGKYSPLPSGSGKSPVQNAKDWVGYELASGTSYTGVIQGLRLYNFVRSINLSETEGSYRITDNWLATPSSIFIPYVETFSVESALDATLLRTVTVNGTVKGLEQYVSGNIYNGTNVPYITGSISGSIQQLYNTNTQLSVGTKIANAISGYSGIKNEMYHRASAFASINNRVIPTPTNMSAMPVAGKFEFPSGSLQSNENQLHPIPVTLSEGINPAEGTITYSWSFNNRPLNIIPGSISETLSVEDSAAVPIIASVFVLGRKLGPVLQDLGTITTSSRSVTFEVVFPRPSSLRDIKFPAAHYTGITGVVESFNPTNLLVNTNLGAGIKSFVKSDTTNWNMTENRLVKTKQWEWIRCYE